MKALVGAVVLFTFCVTPFLSAFGPTRDGGQGTAGENCKVNELNFGTYWAGPKIAHADLIGKVVLVEAWGS